MKTNKWILDIVAVAAVVFSTFNMRAAEATETPVPNLLDTNSPVMTGGVNHGTLMDLELAGKDLYAQFLNMKPFTTNGQATVRAFGGLNTTSREIIYGAMVTVPVSDTFAVGAIVASIGGEFYEGGANLSFGVTKSLPVIGVYRAFAGDGVVYNFISREPANYAFGGFEKTWVLSSKLEIGTGFVTANTSDRGGVDILGGMHITYHW